MIRDDSDEDGGNPLLLELPLLVLVLMLLHRCIG